MKYSLVLLISIISVQLSYSQKSDIDNQIGEAMEQMEAIMDSFDLSNLFDEDLSILFENSLSKLRKLEGVEELEGLDSLIDSLEISNLDLAEILGEIESLSFNGKQLDQLLQQSMDLINWLDLSELSKIVEELNLEDLNIDTLKFNQYQDKTIKEESQPFKKI